MERQNKEKNGWMIQLKAFFQNKNNLLILVLGGILLMVISVPVDNKSKKEKSTEVKKEEEAPDGGKNHAEFWDRESLEKEMEEVLSKMEGAGKVRVLITLSCGEEYVTEKEYPVKRAQSEEESENAKKSTRDYAYEENTVYTTEGNLSAPYIKKTLAPKVAGVLIAAQGGGNASVRTELTEAAAVLLGVETYQVKVIKLSVD